MFFCHHCQSIIFFNITIVSSFFLVTIARCQSVIFFNITIVQCVKRVLLFKLLTKDFLVYYQNQHYITLHRLALKVHVNTLTIRFMRASCQAHMGIDLLAGQCIRRKCQVHRFIELSVIKKDHCSTNKWKTHYRMSKILL